MDSLSTIFPAALLSVTFARTMTTPFNPDPLGLPSFRPQHPLRPEDLRIIAENARQALRTAATGDYNDMGGDVGAQFGPELLPVGFWARITAGPLNSIIPLYSFSEVIDETLTSQVGYTWTTPNGPMIGSFNAMETSGRIDVPTDPNLGPVVWMSPLAEDGFFKFTYQERVMIIEITGALIADPGDPGYGYYPGIEKIWDTAAKDWRNGDSVYWRDANQ